MANEKKKTKQHNLSQSTLSKIAALPLKKQKYIEGRLSGKTKEQSALAAGYGKGVARSTVQRDIETADVTEAIRSIMRDKLSLEHLVDRVIEGLDATETESYLVSQKDAKRAKFEHIDKIAWSERRQYATLASKLFGVKGISSIGVEADKGDDHITVIVDL